MSHPQRRKAVLALLAFLTAMAIIQCVIVDAKIKRLSEHIRAVFDEMQKNHGGEKSLPDRTPSNPYAVFASYGFGRFGNEKTEENDPMGIAILDFIRAKFGADQPDSVALTRALEDLDLRISKNRISTQALEQALPATVIRSIDAGATERRKLAALQSEHAALVATADATRRELAEAHIREKAADLEKAWAAAEEKVRALESAGEQLTAAIDAIVEAATAVLRADADFRPSVPAPPADWSPDSLAANLTHRISVELYIKTNGALRRPAGVFETAYQLAQDPRATIRGAIREHIGIAFKGRMQPADAPAPADLTPPEVNENGQLV